MRVLLLLLVAFLFCQCAGNSELIDDQLLFEDVTEESGISFSNILTYTERLNPYTYRNFYNGAGVAVGDINNDGLPDIYFASNQVGNKLYLNKGNFKFDDITDRARVSCRGVWSTGVTFADVNADGWLDIYVCKSGDPQGQSRYNELFINNHDLTFTERSKEFGLDVIGLSVQSSFFDFDKDGDLDCYLLTNSFKSVGNFDWIKDQRLVPDPNNAGNKFFLNDGGRFVDVTEKVGIYRSAIGFGLGITLGDFNDDTWTDIFVSNDFFERDYLYINNRKGGFTEELPNYFQSISLGSMGADFADLDNDGINELFVTEMLPDSLHRRKSKTVYENWNRYVLNVENGYHHQFSRNVLQKRTSANNYVELGRYAGVAATEWSWGALMFDMDGDGVKDIFVGNGIYKDLLDRDYLSYSGAPDHVRALMQKEKSAILKLIDQMPSSYFSNYAFLNMGDLQFQNASVKWGLDSHMFTSGSAYADFDNDGALDLVVNNLNAPSRIFKNRNDSTRKFISFSFRNDSSSNRFAIGTSVKLFAGGQVFSADNFVTRGFQSCVDSKVTISLPRTINYVDSALVVWPTGKITRIGKLNANQEIKLKEQAAHDRLNSEISIAPMKLMALNSSDITHHAHDLVDFNRDRLLPFMYSRESPRLVKGDVNGDGNLEWFMDQGKGYPSRQFGVIPDLKSKVCFEGLSPSEETGSHLFDADGDGDLDYYYAAGGRYYSTVSNYLQDHLLLNDGYGNFKELQNALPFTRIFSTAIVRSLDFDRDGDLDLFVGERFDPFIYGKGGSGFILENNGQGKFADVTSKVAPTLSSIGMVTDAVVADVNADQWDDLVIVGDWMPVTFYLNKTGSLERSDVLTNKETQGWWNRIKQADLNKDGKPDFVVANFGLNSFFKPLDRMYVGDFDGNGSAEQIFCTLMNGKYYPLADRDDFVAQLPSFKKQLLYYNDYAHKSIDEIFSPEVLKKSAIFEVNELRSIMMLSKANGYQVVPLPNEAQYSIIFGLEIADMDQDGVEDVIAGGNLYGIKPQFGRSDASSGWLFKGIRSNNDYTLNSGIDLNVKGEIRDIAYFNNKQLGYLIFTKYNDETAIYKVQF